MCAMCSCGDITNCKRFTEPAYCSISGTIFVDRGTNGILLVSIPSEYCEIHHDFMAVRYTLLFNSISNISGISIKVFKHHINLFCDRAYQGMQPGRSLVVAYILWHTGTKNPRKVCTGVPKSGKSSDFL